MQGTSNVNTPAMPFNISLEYRHLGEFSFFSFILEKKPNTQLGKKESNYIHEESKTELSEHVPWPSSTVTSQ